MSPHRAHPHCESLARTALRATMAANAANNKGRQVRAPRHKHSLARPPRGDGVKAATYERVPERVGAHARRSNNELKSRAPPRLPERPRARRARIGGASSACAAAGRPQRSYPVIFEGRDDEPPRARDCGTHVDVNFAGDAKPVMQRHAPAVAKKFRSCRIPQHAGSARSARSCPYARHRIQGGTTALPLYEDGARWPVRSGQDARN